MDGTRREFVLIVLGVGGALALDACGDDGGGDASAGCRPNVNFSSNHGHTLNIPAADVAAGTTQTYDITGSADHGHTVTVSGVLFSQLQAGDTVMVGSTASDTGDGHNHDIALRCTG
jgi:hypothetical protein